MHTKDSKPTVLYFKPASIGRAGGARCGACWKFVPGGACLEVEGDISAGGVCGLYVHGMPHHDAADHAWKIQKVSKAESGYSERGDTHCAGCEYMAHPADRQSPCAKVEGLVEQQACCNEYEAR